MSKTAPFLLLAFLSGCAHLNSPVGHPPGWDPTDPGTWQLKMLARTSTECRSLDDAYALWGGLTAAGGALAGISGLSAGVLEPPPGDKGPRLALGITSLMVGAFSAFALYEEQHYASEYGAVCK